MGRATQIDARFKNKLLLPLDPSKGEQTPIVEYALVTNDQLRKIENMAFDEETYTEDVKDNLGSEVDIVMTLSTDNVEKILRTKDIVDYAGSIRVFVGDSAPSAVELRERNFSTLDIDDIQIHYGVFDTDEFGNMIPLS